ncbi:MAG TPA: M36 family metallopeptidase [Blastocatellia bacterium]|nr:M36 family metallopeptidase [Blastocatellia bacterium]
MTQPPPAQVSRLKRERPSVGIRWSSLTGAPSRLYSQTEALSAPTSADAGIAARGFLKGNEDLFRLSGAEVDGLKESRRYRTEHNGVSHLTLQQQVGGIELFQSAMTMHLNREGAIMAAGGELLPGAARAVNLSRPKITAIEALRIAAEQAEAELKEQPQLRRSPSGADQRQEFASGRSFERDVRARLVYFPLAADQVRLAWEFVIWMRETADVYLILIDAEQKTLLFRHNLTNYEENPLQPHGPVYTGESPRPNLPRTSDAPPIVEREDLPFRATPFNGGPIFQPEDPHYDWWAGSPANGLISNNTDVHLDRDAALNQPDQPRLMVPDGNFSFPVDFTLEAVAATNPQAAQVNLFYWINRYHDILYSFGFNEGAGNFQTDNFGLGGPGNDAVIGDAQDGQGLNNANFATPPDGQPGRVQMFLWDLTSPQLDGSFDQGVIIHELTHGLSNRLVGNATGLTALQSRSMGEGWSDWFGLVLLQHENDDPAASYPIGQYVLNDYVLGIRRYPYSTNLQINPLTFNNMRDFPEVHAVGEIWCLMLWELRALLIERYGFREGQRQSIQLVVDGLKMTPSAPSLIDARDAIMLADRVNNQGANQCLIWKAFAKRGLGVSASTPDASSVIAVESFQAAPFCSPVATLALNKPSYVDNETVRITLGDNNAIAPVAVEIASTRTGDRERIELEPDAAIPGLFNGSIRLDNGRARTGDGKLQGSVGARDRIQATHLDRDTGDGSSAQVTALADWTREIVILDDNVERGNQIWLPTGTWAITSEVSGSPTHSWRVRGASDDPLLLQGLALTSPTLDLTGLTEVELSFSQSYQFAGGGRPFSGAIEVSVDDGATWSLVRPVGGSQSGFAPFRLPLGDLVEQPRARLRFRLIPPPLAIGASADWAIDDIHLIGRSADPEIIPPVEAPEPVITAITPAFGPPGGGTQVMISGTNFTESEDTRITFDGVPATQVTVLGSSALRAVTPAHSAGQVTVRISNRRGTATQSRGFTYYEPGGIARTPVLGSAAPSSGSVLGGTTVTLTGTNFTPETVVLFGSKEAAVTYVSTNRLRAVTPAASTTGAVDLTARNGDRQSTLPGAFGYVAATPPAVQILNPQGGERFYTGSEVTIRWQSSDNHEVVRQRLRLAYPNPLFPSLEAFSEIATDVSSESRSFSWTVPSFLQTGSLARIHVIATDDEGTETDAVSGQFEIARRWETREFQTRISSGGQVASDDKYLYLIGQGLVPGQPLGNAMLRYDPETSAFTDGLAPPPTLLNGAEAVHLNGKIYVPGGYFIVNNTIQMSPLHLAYEIATNTWTTQAEVPNTELAYAVVADQAHGVYYFTGGLSLTSGASSAVRKYDPATDTWSELPPMSAPRFSHNAAIIEGKLYVAGGSGPTGNVTGGEVYDFQTGQWSPMAPPNRVRQGAEAAVVKDAAGNPYWLFVGDSSAGPVHDAEVYDVRNDRWIQLDNSFSVPPLVFLPGSPPSLQTVFGSGVIGGFLNLLTTPLRVHRLQIDPLEPVSPGQPLILAVPAAQVGAARTAIKFKVSAGDLGSGVPIAITAEGLPAGARFTTRVLPNNRTEGTFKWTPTTADTGQSFNITFTAGNGQLIDSKVVTVSVVECSSLTLANAGGDGRLAVDSIVTAFGSNLAAGTETALASELPFELKGARVTIDGIPAQIVSVSPDRVSFVIPATVEPGSSTIVVRNSEGAYAIGTAQIVDAAPMIFAVDSEAGGDRPSLIISDGTRLQLPQFERPLQTRPNLITLYGSGIRRARAANPKDGNGVAESVSVTIGGEPARVIYAGAHVTLKGLDQIIVEVPAGLTGTGRQRVEVVVTIDGITANRTMIDLN